MNVFMILEEVGRLGFTHLWPGFDPAQIPLAIYDGERTWLFQHCNPPVEFIAVEERSYTYYFLGLHQSVCANSTIELNGVLTATILLHTLKGLTVKQIASICIHEQFHVFQCQNYPEWSSNSMEQLLYPVESVDNLQLRRLETLAIYRAVGSTEKTEAIRWALTALSLRTQRFACLPEGAVCFEQGTELLEGLAQYIERKSLGLTETELLVQDYPPAEIRLRCYHTGHALALLLDRFNEAWKHELVEGCTLDTLLAKALSRFDYEGKSFTLAEYEASRIQAQKEIKELFDRRQEMRRELFSQSGWVCRIECDSEHFLKLKALDPMNMYKLNQNEVLHTRMIKTGNEFGYIELLDGKAITNGSGESLFRIVKLIIPGLRNRPDFQKKENTIQISGKGFSGEFKNSPFINISITKEEAEK